jgi:flagellar basal-body rod protein FlgB
MIEGIALFELIGRKLDYVSTRHTLLAQNVANADTPGYAARDLKPFAAALDGVSAPPLAATNARHLPPTERAGGFDENHRAGAWEVEPSGNGVSLEEQSIKATDSAREYQLASTLLRKNLSMLRATLNTR